MKRLFFVIFFLPIFAFAQIGGSSTYEFVTMPYSARENAFGGNVISSTEKDLAFALKNPALLDSSYEHEAFLNFGQMRIAQTGTFYGTIGYAQNYKYGITIEGGIHFISYGKCDGYDEDGNFTGEFFPSEYQLIVGASRQIYGNLYGGLTCKPILSYLESYSSYGLLFDAGLTYRFEKSCLALELRNFGCQIKGYTHKNHEPIPYSLDFGYSQRLEHAPVRFNIVYQDIQKFDLSYDDNLSQNNTLLNDEADEERKFVEVGKNFIKHINISGEFLIGKAIVIMAGYNYRKSEELSFGSSKHAAGLSIGLGLNFSRFKISYSLAKQNAAGSWQLFTLGINTQTIYSLYQNHKSQKLQK